MVHLNLKLSETIDLLSIIPPPYPLLTQDLIDDPIDKRYKTNLHKYAEFNFE